MPLKDVMGDGPRGETGDDPGELEDAMGRLDILEFQHGGVSATSKDMEVWRGVSEVES
jgi:hypothetical protein